MFAIRPGHDNQHFPDLTREAQMTVGSVLIVEDDSDLLMLFRTVLKRSMSVEQIFTASGGEAAIKLLGEQTPDVIVLDLAMPHTNGNDVIHFILSQPRLDTTRIVVVTAVPMRLSVEGLGRVSQVLVKPVNPHDLEHAITQPHTKADLKAEY